MGDRPRPRSGEGGGRGRGAEANGAADRAEFNSVGGRAHDTGGGSGRGRRAAAEGTAGGSDETGGGSVDIKRLEARGGGGGGHAHAGGPFTGLRFVLLRSSGQEELEARIVDMGGQVLSSVDDDDFKVCTHVCVRSQHLLEDLKDAMLRQGKKVVNHAWVNECFDRNMLLDAEPACHCQGDEGIRVVSEDKSSRPVFGSESASSLGRSVRRKYSSADDEEIYHRHHDLFLCKRDGSPKISLHDYAAQMQDRLAVTVATPGSLSGHVFISTVSEVRLIVMRIFVLVRCLHEAGLTLAGQFNSRNVVIDELRFRKNVRFGHLPKGALKKCNPDDEELDLVRFDRMIRRELFIESVVPHDLNVWLALIGEKGFEELLLDHISLMQDCQSFITFLSLCDEFVEMEHKDAEKYKGIISDMSGYSDWKQRVNSREGNSYLQETLGHIDQATNKTEYYEDDIRGLLKLLMNFCEPAGKLRTAALTVRGNFPNLLPDFQKKMYKAGYYVPKPRLEWEYEWHLCA